MIYYLSFVYKLFTIDIFSLQLKLKVSLNILIYKPHYIKVQNDWNDYLKERKRRKLEIDQIMEPRVLDFKNKELLEWEKSQAA
jgi:hypothetical protein